MADTSAAVSVALSKLAALQDVNQYKLSRRARRHAAAIANSLRETHAAVALTAEAEAQHELHTAQSSSSNSGLVGDTMLMLQKIIDQLEDLDPRSAAGHCSTSLREVCYDVEDAVDAVFTADLDSPSPAAASGRRRGGGGVFWGVTTWLLVAMTRLGVRLQCGEIRRRAAKKTEDFGKLMTEVRAVPISVPVDDDGDAHRRRRRPPITEAAPYGLVVGVGPQRDEVVEMLRLGEEEELRVVTIVGPVGMGKTTLAHEVYRTVGPSFDCRAWVSASSRSYGDRDILIDILLQVEEEDHPHGGGVTDLHLMEKMDGILQDKRYLIVLDNVSTSTARTTVVSALPRNALGSRVLVTTSDSFGQLNLRNWPVWNNHAYMMQPLSRSYDDIVIRFCSIQESLAPRGAAVPRNWQMFPTRSCRSAPVCR
ncbi:hypothetical protein QOZ80_9BG0714350 [Eleusine coracana subsp. coracana]|nr:hypothetical protein QOZ80_9BG0714350 [Eleusine coracana subsp. coracana]